MEPTSNGTSLHPDVEEARRLSAVLELRRIALRLSTAAGHVLEGDIPLDEAEALIARLTTVVAGSA